MTAGQISTSPTSARTACTTTTTTERSAMWPKRPGWLWGTGRRAQRGEITTATAASISSFGSGMGYVHYDFANPTGTGKWFRPRSASASFAVSRSCVVPTVCAVNPTICSTTTAMVRSPTSASAPVSPMRTATTAWHRCSSMSTAMAGPTCALVADDSTPQLSAELNKGDGTFEDASFASGYALNESGRLRRRRWASPPAT